MRRSNTIHDLPKEDRPRERLQNVGVDNLSIQELLALVIERGYSGKNALSLAQDLLSYFGNVANIKDASVAEIQNINGVGKATACKIKGALKLGEKARAVSNKYEQKISDSDDIFNLLRTGLENKKREHLKIVSLDSRNKVVDVDNISIGTLSDNLAHPREIFKHAIKNSAKSVVLVHNHPSGDPNPSHGDVETTKKIKKSGDILGIPVVEHVIIGKDKHFSFKENNLI